MLGNAQRRQVHARPTRRLVDQVLDDALESLLLADSDAASFALAPGRPLRWSAEMPTLLGLAGADEDTVSEALGALLLPITAGLGSNAVADRTHFDLEHDLAGGRGDTAGTGPLRRLRIRARGSAHEQGWLVGVVTGTAADGGTDIGVADRYRLLLELSPDAMIVHDAGTIVYANPAALRFAGAQHASDLLGRAILDFVAPESRRDMLMRIAELNGPGAVSEAAEASMLRLDGTSFVMESTSVRTTWNGRPAFQVILRDLTERRAAEAALQLQADLVEQVSDAIIATDLQGLITSWNPASEKTFGWAAEATIGAPLEHFLGPEGARVVAAGSGSTRTELRLLRRDGTPIDVELAVSAVSDAAGRLSGRAVICTDITERRQRETERQVAEDRLLHQSRHDGLTGLANRTRVLERLAEGLLAGAPAGDPAVLFIDLDRFKSVNDTLGHSAGDHVLRLVGRRISGAVRPHDLVGRLAGDEFVVVASGLTSEAAVDELAEHVLASLADPLQVNGRQLTVSASIGIARADPLDPGDAEDLLRDADVAMYAAKQEGRGRYVHFDTRLAAQARYNLELEEDLRSAITSGGMSVAYQPVVDLARGTVAATEALARWRHPERGFISPALFVPVAEETGLIGRLGADVLVEACARTRGWRDGPKADLRVAVNLSGRQLSDPQLVPSVLETLQRCELPPSAVSLEITESVLMTDPDAAAATLKGLAEIGVGLSVDDFGTGYSSLSYLRQFPVDTIKIDRSFVSDICSDQADLAIVDSVIGLAHRLNLRTVAEGAETEEQVAMLRELGCAQVQGYYFSRPLDPADLPDFLTRPVRG